MSITVPPLALVFAQDENGIIGKNNTIPWHSPHDFKFFKSLTEGGNVIMGRKTWESLPKKPLPNRNNYVISRNPDYEAPGALVFPTLEAALADCVDKSRLRSTFVIGGKELFKAAEAHTDLAYVSRIGVRTPLDETCVMAPDWPFYEIEERTELFGGDDTHPSVVMEMVRFFPSR
ncbi:hypothetical protein [Ralstonia phage RP31]|uniref:dihydrofolate reductase n=2 Tax=Ripduovirus RP12 TaxID=2560700 RepID=A0A1L7N103_9CAUD|nr:dihydrofolate reductase [Ralstonia phage RP12]BAW19159.1 hypothetical protein [Ralstonia phage RP12]BAW19445.1 hypothetical protein [Ralstonia phage RP31]